MWAVILFVCGYQQSAVIVAMRFSQQKKAILMVNLLQLDGYITQTL
jgi:hypothetical protein